MPNALEVNGRLPHVLIGPTQVGKSVGNRCIRNFAKRSTDPNTTIYTSAERMSLVLTFDEIQASLASFNQMLSQEQAEQNPYATRYANTDAFTLNPSWEAVGWQSFDALSEGGKKGVDNIRGRLGYPEHSVDGKKFIFLDMVSAEVAGQSDFDSMLTQYITTNSDAIFDLGLVIGVVVDTTDPATVAESIAKNDLIREGLDIGLGDGTYQELARNGKLIHFIYENKMDLPSKIMPQDRQELKKAFNTPYYHKVSFKTDSQPVVMNYLVNHPVIAYNNNACIGGWQ